MSDRPDYYGATNAAYRLLLRSGVADLPVPVEQLVRNLSLLRTVTYTDLCLKMGIDRNELYSFIPSEKGYLVRDSRNKRGIIFYEDLNDSGIIRFTLAHELGHYVLEHTVDSLLSEREANCFARNLICPVPVSDLFQLNGAGDFCSMFGITPPAAEVAVDKRPTDFWHINESNYSGIRGLFRQRTDRTLSSAVY